MYYRKQKQRCEQQEVTSIRTSNGSHLYWKNHFRRNPLCFGIIAVFEANIQIDDSVIGNKTTINYSRNPVLNGYYTISELEDVLKSGYQESPLGYDNVDWFVDEVIKLEHKMFLYFKNTNKSILLIEKDDEDYRSNKFYRVCRKEKIVDKVAEHCHLTGKYIS